MKSILKNFALLFTSSLLVVCLSNCKPEEKTYPKESYLDDFFYAELEYNNTAHLVSINRDTNHLNVTFDNGPAGKAYLIIDANKNSGYYFELKLRLDSLAQLKPGTQFPINNSGNIGTASCLHLNKTYSEYEFSAKSGNLYIDQLYGYDEIKVRFDANLTNGAGDNVKLANGKMEYD